MKQVVEPPSHMRYREDVHDRRQPVQTLQSQVINVDKNSVVLKLENALDYQQKEFKSHDGE
jgi:hypothetical protein